MTFLVTWIAQHGGVRASGYGDEDPLFGAMPSVYDTTAAHYDESAYPLSYPGYDSTTMWDAPGHAGMSSSAADPGLAEPSGYIAQWGGRLHRPVAQCGSAPP